MTVISMRRCGSGDDPEDIPGLAHLTEHMLFLGSEKYPAKSYFDDVWEMLGLAKLISESRANVRLAYSASRWYLALTAWY
jgi:predicted Zn-dependent peptidase